MRHFEVRTVVGAEGMEDAVNKVGIDAMGADGKLFVTDTSDTRASEVAFDWIPGTGWVRENNGPLETYRVTMDVTIPICALEKLKSQVQDMVNKELLGVAYDREWSVKKLHDIRQNRKVIRLSTYTPTNSVCVVDLVPHFKPSATRLERTVAAHELLVCCLWDNEEVPGGPSRASMYVQERNDGCIVVRMECMDEADLTQATLLCGFEEDNFLE